MGYLDLYILPIKSAVIIFPFLALLFTFPFAYKQYHHYGTIQYLKAGILYSFIFYLLCVYFLVILPLPAKESTIHESYLAHLQFIPFNSIFPYFKSYGISVNSFKHFLSSFYFYQFAYNILMIIPFGIYLRYYFKFSLQKTILYSFLFSFFLEMTQLTGLYGYYPGPYRCGDIDDLICNTLGGTIGYLIAPAFTYFLPKKEVLDLIHLDEAVKITPVRLLVYLLTDLTIVFTPILFIGYIGKLTNYHFPILFTLMDFYIVLFLIYLILVNIGDGDSPGTTLCNMKLVNDQLEIPTCLQLMIRYSILAIELIFLHYFHSILCLLFVIYILFRKHPMLFEKLSHTHFVSCKLDN